MIINKIIEKISKYSNIAIVGFGLEGKSTYKFIRRYLPNISVTIIDMRNAYDMLPELKKDQHVSVVYGDNYLDNLERFDLIFKSPGVSFKNLNKDILREKITSQIELLLEFNRDNMIGITGSKGKSTTSSLIYQIIKDQGIKTCLVGNIGVPVFDELDIYTEDTIVVTEMSCNQLEFVNVSPHIGLVLNIYQDHLDTIGNLENYERAKMNMFLKQSENDYGIYDSDNETIVRWLNNMEVKSKLYSVSVLDDADISFKEGNVYQDGKLLIQEENIKRNILGMHNLKNIMFALEVVKILKLDFSLALKTISSFVGLEHRMEFVGKYKGITFYNDTIATIPQATMLACNTIENLDTLIFGGQDRGIDYSLFIDYLKNSSIKNFICMPTTGYMIGDCIDNGLHNIYKVELLEDAVKLAFDITEEGKSCLLSPAAASYEYFKNFEEKGKKYKEYIELYK